jgi:hemoglobin
MTESSLYERLGGVFAIAAVIDKFSDAVVQNPIVGQRSENPALREWHTNNLGRLPGLKVHAHPLGLRRWRAGPFEFSATRPAVLLSASRRPIEICGSLRQNSTKWQLNSRAPWTSFNVPDREKDEVLGAFAAHKNEVTEGYTAAVATEG